MKTFTIFLICGLSTLFAVPQSYHKLIRTNVHWDVYNIIEPELSCYTSAERIYFTNQDTVINGRNYRISKLQTMISLNQYGDFCPPLAVQQTAYNTYQFMREDTVAKKVYIYTPDFYGGKDQLLYDFSLNPGDTLQTTYYTETFVLDSIGTFYLNDGETRKIFWFHLDYSVSPPYYIESIGNEQGLFAELTPPFEHMSGYLCVQDNSINLLGDVCENYYVGHNEQKNGVLTIYPNPSFDFINIDIPAKDNESVMILYNSQGVQIKSITLKNGPNSITVSDIIPGIYNYRIYSHNGLIHGKITIL